MKCSEMIKQANVLLPNTQVMSKYVIPLFTRSGDIHWSDEFLWLLRNSEYPMDGEQYLNSKVLNEHEIAVFLKGLINMYVYLKKDFIHLHMENLGPLIDHFLKKNGMEMNYFHGFGYLQQMMKLIGT